MNKLINKFILDHPKIVNEMQSCTHAYSDTKVNPYHIEGTVWSHTMMVCKEIEKLLVDSSEDERVELMWAALLHDIAKFDTRYKNTEREMVTFNGHESLGVFRAIDVLKKEKSLSEENIKNIALLVGLHSCLQRNRPERVGEMFRGNRGLLGKTLKLYIADNNGRYSIAEPRDLCEDFQVEDRHQKEASNTVNVLVGPPLSGKTQFANKCKGSSSVVISKDAVLKKHFSHLGKSIKQIKTNFKEGEELRLVEIFEKEIGEAVRKGKDIYVDANNLTKKERGVFLDSTLLCDYKKKAVVFFVGYEELLRRNKTKKRIPNFIISKECRKFNNPFYDEFDEVEYKIF